MHQREDTWGFGDGIVEGPSFFLVCNDWFLELFCEEEKRQDECEIDEDIKGILKDSVSLDLVGIYNQTVDP